MIPKLIKPVLWSYDSKKMDLKKDKKIIISQVLNFGTKKMTDWMFENYTKAEIKQILKDKKGAGLDKKSLNFWKIIFNIKK